jgi:hypothetical protein
MITSSLRRILELQKLYTPTKSEPMDERGQLIKHDLPDWLNSNLYLFNPNHLIQDLEVEGQDGIGNKSRVPWVRVYSASRSPKAPIGWYVVFLFSESGEDFYITLGHGSTNLLSRDLLRAGCLSQRKPEHRSDDGGHNPPA